MEHSIMILPEIPILEAAMAHGNVHSELDGSHYLYMPFCFKYTADKRLFIEPMEKVPEHIKKAMTEFGLRPRRNNGNGAHVYELVGPRPEPVFVDFTNLTEDEKNDIIKMSEGWEYGKQVILQSEFEKKPKDAQ